MPRGVVTLFTKTELKRRAGWGTEKFEFDQWVPWRKYLLGMNKRDLLRMPGPPEEALPGHPKCREFSKAIKVIL